MPSFATNDPSDLLRHLRADQSERWRRGDPVRVESYLEHYPHLAEEPEALLALIDAEVRWREEKGDRPSLDEYLARFPSQTDALRRRWAFRAFAADRTVGQTSTPAAAPAVTQPLRSGQLTSSWLWLPGYEVLGVLGRGGMGVVFKARQLAFDRLVAIKMIRGFLLNEAAEQRRFHTEAVAVGRVDHPHVVRVHAFGEEQGCPYFVMEYLAGGSLADLLQGGPLAPRHAAELVRQVALGVQAAHDRGVVHRDLKPGNVLLDEKGNARVTDFGLAKLLDRNTGQTGSEAVLGTPAYMAPEQAAGLARQVGEPADVWALGVILYECLTGQRPFPAQSSAELRHRIQHDEPMSPRQLRAEVPGDLEIVCLRCLQKRPEQRYATAAAVARELERWLAGEPVTAVRPVTTVPARGRGRAVRALAALLTFLMLCGLGGGLLLAPAPVAAPLPADEKVRRALRDARPGQPVLLYARGWPPAWSNVPVGKDQALVSAERGKTLQLTTFWACLYELLPPGAGRGPFRLTVEMRHSNSVTGLAVGPYVGRQEHRFAGGRGHTFALLGLTDPELRNELGQPFPVAPLATLTLGYLEPRGDSPPVHRMLRAGPDVPLTAAPPLLRDRTAWRVLVLEVRPDSVRIGCGAAVSAAQPTRQLQLYFRTALRRDAQRQTVRPSYAPSGGAGLFVIGGAIEVRRALVEPLGRSFLTPQGERTMGNQQPDDVTHLVHQLVNDKLHDVEKAVLRMVESVVEEKLSRSRKGKKKKRDRYALSQLPMARILTVAVGGGFPMPPMGTIPVPILMGSTSVTVVAAFRGPSGATLTGTLLDTMNGNNDVTVVGSAAGPNKLSFAFSLSQPMNTYIFQAAVLSSTMTLLASNEVVFST